MQHQYWGDQGRTPAKKEIIKVFKKDRPAQRTFTTQLGVFERQDYEQMVKNNTITPFHDSPSKLKEWKFSLPGRTARMFFIVFEDCAWFLHFIVKKSTKDGKTPPESRKIAEQRGSMCRDELEAI